jgi:hypothetical protein
VSVPQAETLRCSLRFYAPDGLSGIGCPFGLCFRGENGAGVEKKTPPFGYQDSQIEALHIHQEPDADIEQIKRILDHYGAWQYSPLED